MVPMEKWYNDMFWKGEPNLTRGYAPFPVFFEVEPDDHVIDYSWSFGRKGATSAHVFAEPGNYLVTLTKTDCFMRVTKQQVAVEVLARNGRTFQVDAVDGDDAADGIARPWKTATKAFLQLHVKNFYQPGDQVLFKAGQVFDLNPGKVNTAQVYGLYFGRYGEGEDPVIKRKVAESTLCKKEMFRFNTYGLNHVTFEHLCFDGMAEDGTLGTVFASVARVGNILFTNCEFKNAYQFVGIDAENTRIVNNASCGVFIHKCYLHNDVEVLDRTNLQLYFKCKRVAVLDSILDKAGNHLIYGAWVQSGVFDGNTFMRPAFGRHCLRISSVSDMWSVPSRNVTIRNNQFVGWVDPVTVGAAHQGGGTRYNWLLLQIGPQTAKDQQIQDVWITGNTFTDFETAIEVSAAENVVVDNNTFRTPSDQPAAGRVRIGGNMFERRPCRNVQFVNNKFDTNEARKNGIGILFHVCGYGRAPFKGQTEHEQLYFWNNSFNMQNKLGLAYLTYGLQQISSKNTWTFNGLPTTGEELMVQVGGNYQGGTRTPLKTVETKAELLPHEGPCLARFGLQDWA
jgi:hypothetical protein